MIYWIGFYWLCAGLASFNLDKMFHGRAAASFGFSMLLGGVAIPARILAKLAN